MATRNNSDRIGAQATVDSPVPNTPTEDTESTPFQFVTPTDFVELPSQGKYYPEGHSLHNKETVEIRFMTAKDEDILSSTTLLKKGIAIERMLKNVIVDKSINTNDLLVGDKNAILVSARITGYGSEYCPKITCPVCGTHTELEFDLNNATLKQGGTSETFSIELQENNNFMVSLPLSKAAVEVRLMKGDDERKLMSLMEQRKKQKADQTILTDQLKMAIVSVNGETDRNTINNFIAVIPAMDSRYLREALADVAPAIDLMQDFTCSSCDYEQELEVPFTADFFWPRR